MVGNLRRGFGAYQNDGILLSFLHHTRAMMGPALRPALRYKSLPFLFSQPSSCPASMRLYQSRTVQFKHPNGEYVRPELDKWSAPGTTDNSQRNASPNQFTDLPSQSNSGNSSEKERDWDLLSSAIDSLKSSSDPKLDVSLTASRFSEARAQVKRSSMFSCSDGDVLAGMMPPAQKNARGKPEIRKARVALEDSRRFNQSDPVDETPDRARKAFARDSDYGSQIKMRNARSGKSVPLARMSARRQAKLKTWQETTVPGDSAKESLGVQTIGETPLEKEIYIPFEKANRRPEDIPENWHEVEMPDRNTVGEQTLRYQGKVYGFAAGDKDELVSGIGAFGPGKLAKELGNRAIKQITTELDACISSGRGDIGIWRVCEERIFAMLKLFSVEDEVITATMPHNEAISKRSSRLDRRLSRKCHMKTEMASETPSLNDSRFSDPLDIPVGIPRKPFVLHTFPATLLYAIRLLHTHFPMSEITIQMHAAIKARGRIARLLASDTEIFNELISYHWRVHNDLPLVNILLKEMEDNGATISSRTMELLNEIADQNKRERLLSRTSEKTALGSGAPWISDLTYRAYKEFIGIRGQFEGLFSKVKKLRRFEGHKSKITEKMHRKLPVDIKGSASTEYSHLHKRRGNFMPCIDDDAE
ncbi:hypothetical protein I7I51_00455 [Histoplasma capsulatum]|uniref:Mtf2-like C-terminal domain-containing protein n=1 Tax=Ajellomyces capsulatus TaxID=5037 RepID=A0A8A1MGY9_AJECA|nr:predicted protein [Histoplasma mississippiense (nom. inval.)]EDN08802.1 predicted protein [Histoplasma mississippiense (nom. inval.)]QSS63397.1 hypothetical protein I7I51_00455 [Histoplasma capsulatum]